MPDPMDVYSRLKGAEKQKSAGRWLFNTAPQRIADFHELKDLLLEDRSDEHSHLLSACREVVPVRYHETRSAYSFQERATDGSWVTVEREAPMRTIRTVVQGTYVWPPRYDRESEDLRAGNIVNLALPMLIAKARGELWGEVMKLISEVDPISANGRSATAVFDEVYRRMEATAGSTPTHVVVHPDDLVRGSLRFLHGDSTTVVVPPNETLLTDLNCPRGQAFVIDATRLQLGISELGAQIRTYPDVSERGYELCAEMVTSVGLWATRHDVILPIREAGLVRRVSGRLRQSEHHGDGGDVSLVQRNGRLRQWCARVAGTVSKWVRHA